MTKLWLKLMTIFIKRVKYWPKLECLVKITEFGFALIIFIRLDKDLNHFGHASSKKQQKQTKNKLETTKYFFTALYTHTFILYHNQEEKDVYYLDTL